MNFYFQQSVAFEAANAAEILRGIPALPGVFALRGAVVEGQAEAQPYLTRAADLRRRITRMLAPPEFAAKAQASTIEQTLVTTPTTDGQSSANEQSANEQFTNEQLTANVQPASSPVLSKRLNLRGRVAQIEYSVTGSEFESVVTLYHAAAAIYGLAEARRRLRLRTPFFLRFTAENAFPRVYSTNRLSRRALANYYGPFPSRAAADRYCDAVLDLFKLRRCSEELAPAPEHPGCVYQEMKKCLAPCNQACTAAGAGAYAAEAAAVEAFFETRGESLLGELTAQREQASAEMEFERAAQIHAQVMRVKAAAALADEIVQPIPRLRAVIVQAAAETEENTDAAVFLVEGGSLAGPARLSTLGVRAVKEQTSVGSSLFAQPLILQPVPLVDAGGQTPVAGIASAAQSDADSNAAINPAAINPTTINPVATDFADGPTPRPSTLNPEERAAQVLGDLAARVAPQPKSAENLARLSDHLSLLRRWYYRPEKQRAGEVFLPREEGAKAKAEGGLPKAEGSWPIRRILRGAARVALGDLRLVDETTRDSGQANAEAAAPGPVKTKTLHKGRPEVERVVPVLGGSVSSTQQNPPQSESPQSADTLPAAKSAF